MQLPNDVRRGALNSMPDARYANFVVLSGNILQSHTFVSLAVVVILFILTIGWETLKKKSTRTLTITHIQYLCCLYHNANIVLIYFPINPARCTTPIMKTICILAALIYFSKLFMIIFFFFVVLHFDLLFLSKLLVHQMLSKYIAMSISSC